MRYDFVLDISLCLYKLHIMAKPRGEPFVFGRKIRVDFFLSPTGQCPARKFLNGKELSKIQQARVLKIIQYFAGHGKTFNTDLLAKLKGKQASGFYEFRDVHFQNQIFLFLYKQFSHSYYAWMF
jgi:hypothetical protein